MTTISPDVLEQNYLDQLWAIQGAVHGRARRMEVLKELAGVVIRRDDPLDYAAMRAERPPMSLEDHCFVCGTEEDRIYRHHVIQLQHGGSNTPRNVVPLCHACHREIHPWLAKGTSLEKRRGWTSVADWARAVLEALGIRPRKELP